MEKTFQLLYVGARAPDWVYLAVGSGELHECGSLADVPGQVLAHHFDVVLMPCLDEATLARLPAWPGLTTLVNESALIVVAPEVSVEHALRLVQLGVQDVVSLEQAQKDLERLMTVVAARRQLAELRRKGGSIDLATGLPHQTHLMEHLSQLCALREREPAPMALVVLQVEGFETVKSRMGVEVASSLQRKIAVRLRAALRASDLVASLGRDRYAVLLARIDVQADAERVASKLVAAICQPVRVRTETVSVSARAGIAHHPRDGVTADELFRYALADADAADPGLTRGGFSSELETGWMPAANEDF